MAAEAGMASPGLSVEERKMLLSGVPAFARLPEEALTSLTGRLQEERYSAGSVVVAEGDPGDRLYLISRGEAEVTTNTRGGPVPLAALGPGELFGEIALLEPGGKRQATVTATTDLVALSLAAPVFGEMLDAHPEARAAFREMAESLLVAKFLKQASPFSTLDGERLRRLASRLGRRTAAAGEAATVGGAPQRSPQCRKRDLLYYLLAVGLRGDCLACVSHHSISAPPTARGQDATGAPLRLGADGPRGGSPSVVRVARSVERGQPERKILGQERPPPGLQAGC